MTDLPRAVLSEHFQERMKGRRLCSAVFLTFQFDPGFFEQEVLPVFLDVPLSHAPAIRLVQLELALRSLPGQLAVYYDANGLVIGDAGSAKLDVNRFAVQHRTGIFHPKNVLLLVEDENPDDDQDEAKRTLIVASLSANLTRSGWWENVEACHVEEIAEGDRTRLKDDLIEFLDRLRNKVSAEKDHRAVRDILSFLRGTDQSLQKSVSGKLHTHFYSGAQSLIDFLVETAGSAIHETYLEIISPFFDDASDCAPLRALIDRFNPKATRVFLPRSASGEGLCNSELYQAVREIPDVDWGRLPKDILRGGTTDDAADRVVHAKVYRFFTQNPKREICFVGSANLTNAAHQFGGNAETGFLVDWTPDRRPEFWLTPDLTKPKEFKVLTEDEGVAASGGTPLNLRYYWDTSIAEAFWDATQTSPELRIEARGVEVGRILPLTPRTWTELPPEIGKRIGELLRETSLFQVYGAGVASALLLVQEQGMSHRPSLLLDLSVADILRYWSLLSVEQRAAFLEARAPECGQWETGSHLVTKARLAVQNDTLFDRFAGVFHAFGCLERAVRSALDADNEKEATYRLFGKKYDSLGNLLDRVASDVGSVDDVDRYVTVMCARQLCKEVSRDYPDYWSAHTADSRGLEDRFTASGQIRQRLLEQNPADFAEFLAWFDDWFLRRATPVVEESQA